jgi:hypothetical protein
MKLQMISINKAKKNVNGRLIAIMIAAIFALPGVAFSQQAEDEQQVDETESSTSTGTGPWQNSAGSVIGNSANGSTVSTTSSTAAEGANKPARDPRLGPNGGSLNRGAVGDGRDPGGNPDVPFDENMSLVFLAGAIAFAYAVSGKKMRTAAALKS